LRDRPLAKDVTARWLAEQTQGFSGAEIEGVCHRAMMAVLGSRIEASPEQPDATGVEVRREHLQAAIEELSPRTARVEHE
jgi:transitional endoplasmic reticulum ATPase